ncbi:MAG: hypothetical protein EAY66_08075 [Sphingobacteriales bacterium]|jgi:hypothetical protein|nr:MAG: hypothetical protein EAY66_08075 [Sphingobacteriales bacterium]
MNYKVYFLLLFFIVPYSAQCQSINLTTNSVPFLRISPDAKAGGMGETGIATNPDANASFWNIAKIPFSSQKTSFSVNYSPWLRSIAKDVSLSSFSGYYQLTNGQAISTSLRYFNLGNIQFTNATGQNLETYSPREVSFDLGYSKKLSNELGLGVAFRYINSNLTSPSIGGENYKAGTAFAADVSLFYDAKNAEGEGFNLGFSASNLGSKIGYSTNASEKDFIPANLGIGTSYTTILEGSSKLSFALDVNKLLVPDYKSTGNTQQDQLELAKYRGYGVVESWFKPNKSYNGSLGIEYDYNDLLFLRTGFFYENRSQGNRQYLTTGFGINYDKFGLNASYIIPTQSSINNINPLANTIRLNLIFNLAKSSAPKTEN